MWLVLTNSQCLWVFQYWQREHEIWCLSFKNSLECFNIVIKSLKHLNSPTFPFLADKKLNLHGVNSVKNAEKYVF